MMDKREKNTTFCENCRTKLRFKIRKNLCISKVIEKKLL